MAAVPYLIPASALGKGGAVPPSERIVVGGIGIQHRGMHDLRWIMGRADVQFVAICDLQKKQRLAVKEFVDKQYGTKDCAMYPEIREFLAARPGHRRGADRHRRPLARPGLDPGDAGGQGRLHREAVVHDDRRGAGRGRDGRRYGRVYQTGTQRLSEANHVFCIEMARTGRLGKIHTAYAHIAPWDAAEMRTTGCRPSSNRPRTRWTGTPGWAPAPGGPTTPATCPAGGGAITISTPVASASGARTRSPRPRPAWAAANRRPVEYEYVDNDSGDGMVTHFANGVQMILSRGNKYWHGSCGERFDGTEGWAAAADGYSQPDVSSPALLGEYKRVVGEYVARTGRSLDHMRNFLDCVRSREQTVANPGGHAPLHDHRPRRQHLHVAQAESQVRSGQGRVRRRRRGQPPALARHAGTVRLLSRRA